MCCYRLGHCGALLWPWPSPRWAHAPHWKARLAQQQADTRGPHLPAKAQRELGGKGAPCGHPDVGTSLQPATQPWSPMSQWSTLLPGPHTQRARETHGGKSEGHMVLPCTSHPSQDEGRAHSPTPQRHTNWARSCSSRGLSSPFIPRLEFGQQGGPPPLGLEDGARRQVGGVVTGVVLVLEQPDVLQQEDRRSEHDAGPPTSSPSPRGPAWLRAPLGPMASEKRHPAHRHSGLHRAQPSPGSGILPLSR